MGMRSGIYKKLATETIFDQVSTVRTWTEHWFKRSASDLTKADGREVLKMVEAAGKSKSYQVRLKAIVSSIYNWGIEERLILGVRSSPMEGLQIQCPKGEKVPEILNLEQIREFLKKAKDLDHPWYPIWATALLTGMRNGELHALLWSDIDFENRKITVSKSFNTRTRSVKSTKAGYWRTVPISSELMELLLELKAKARDQEHVLPHSCYWDKGWQAKILRTFCVGVGLPSIKFHTLRACFGTQLLAHDVAPARVMKICGWKDLKTMQHYIRLAGVDERGATECLRMLSSDDEAMAEVVNLFEFKARPSEKGP
jgi:integrase